MNFKIENDPLNTFSHWVIASLMGLLLLVLVASFMTMGTDNQLSFEQFDFETTATIQIESDDSMAQSNLSELMQAEGPMAEPTEVVFFKKKKDTDRCKNIFLCVRKSSRSWAG